MFQQLLGVLEEGLDEGFGDFLSPWGALNVSRGSSSFFFVGSWRFCIAARAIQVCSVIGETKQRLTDHQFLQLVTVFCLMAMLCQEHLLIRELFWGRALLQFCFNENRACECTCSSV